MCIIGLFQNPGDFISTLVLVITLIVLVFYTIATFGLKKAAVKQTELNLRPFVVICIFTDNAGLSERLVYKNIGHSPAIDVRTEPFDAEAFFLDFERQSLIEVGEMKELNPKGRGKNTLGEGLIRSVRIPSFTPKALAERNSDLDLILNIRYKNIEQICYRTRVRITKACIEIQGTERINRSFYRNESPL
jgi:hypothetical protein